MTRATTRAHGTLADIISVTDRHVTVRVRAATVSTARHPSMNTMGTNAIPKRGTTTRATTRAMSAAR